jgi:hypothetical protein
MVTAAHCNVEFCKNCGERGRKRVMPIDDDDDISSMLVFDDRTQQTLVCDNGHKECSWGVCLICLKMDKPIQRTQILTKYAAKRHKGYHKEAPSSDMEMDAEMVVDEFPPLDVDDVDDASHSHQHQSASDSAAGRWPMDGNHPSWATKELLSSSMKPDLRHLQPASEEFFGHGGTVAKGASYLVARSQLQDEKARAGSVVKGDENLVMKIAELVVTMTTGQQDIFGCVLGMLVNREPTVNDVPPGKIRARIPTTRTQFRNVILEGKHAIVPNLPMPKIVSLEGGHSYVGLKDILGLITAFNVPMEPLVPNHDVASNSKVGTINETAKAQIMLDWKTLTHQELSTVCLPVIIWKDDMDPHSGIATANRGSVHVFSATIAIPPQQGGHHFRDNTFLIALGPKGADHNVVEQMFRDELNELRSSGKLYFFHGGLGMNIPLCADLFCALMDTPEMRSNTGLAAHNSLVHPRWRYTSSLTSVNFWSLPSCYDCYTARLNRRSGEPSCTSNCCDWDMMAVGEVGDQLRGPLPKGFPDSEVDNEHQDMGVEELTVAILLQRCKKTCEKVYLGSQEGWSAVAAKAYLKASGLSEFLFDLVVEWTEEQRDAEVSLPEILTTLPEMVLPGIWFIDGFDLDDIVNVPMHLLFLGIGRSTTKLINRWLKANRVQAPFLRMFSGLLDTEAGKNRINWLKLRSFEKGALSGWISENVLAFVRLYKWFYSCIDAIQSEPVEADPDPSRQGRWKVPQLKTWLRNRGQERVKADQTEPGGPSPRLTPKGGPVINVLKVVRSLVAMVATLMQKESDENHIIEVDRAVKLFLSDITNLDKALYDSESPGSTFKPLPLAKPNFIALLNLARQIAKYGPLRLYYEGGIMGEGILKFVKHLFPGFNQNWEITLMKRFYEAWTLRQVNRELAISTIVGSGNDGKGTSSVDEESFLRYSSREHIQGLLKSGGFLFGVVLRDSSVGFALKGNGGLILVDFDDANHVHVGDLDIAFTPVSLGMQWGQDGAEEKEWEKEVECYCAFLPRFSTEGETIIMGTSAGFYVITSEWTERLSDGSFTIPRNNS